MNCKDCKHGKYDKRTDTTFCRLLNRTLIVNRADNCKNCELKTEIKKCRERMKEREDGY